MHGGQGAGATTSDNQSDNQDDQPAGQAPTARPGRRRRAARTPSQISTKSLPPYMKEPGDQELVIFKCAYVNTVIAYILLT